MNYYTTGYMYIYIYHTFIAIAENSPTYKKCNIKQCAVSCQHGTHTSSVYCVFCHMKRSHQVLGVPREHRE